MLWQKPALYPPFSRTAGVLMVEKSRFIASFACAKKGDEKEGDVKLFTFFQ